VVIAGCAEPLDYAEDVPTPIGECGGDRDEVSPACFVSSKEGGSWAGSYWLEPESTDPDLRADPSKPNALSVVIPQSGSEGFLVYNQRGGEAEARLRPTNSVVRLEVNEVPAFDTSAQILFGVGVEFERLLFVVEHGEIHTRRDLGVVVETPYGEMVQTGPYEKTSINEESSFQNENTTQWLEFREHRGQVYFSVGKTESDLSLVRQMATPYGLQDEAALTTIQIGRWQVEANDPGTVTLGTFCHCPLEE